MSNQKTTRGAVTKANKAISRPEDSDTHRVRRKARLLKVHQLPEAAAAVTQAEENTTDDSETREALRRATRREN
jgi:hypothetical protein